MTESFRARAGLSRAVVAAFAVVVLAVGLLPFAIADASAEEASQSSPIDAVVGVAARVPADARTAEHLGTEREGSGVVIGDGDLVLTIGYLIMEADQVEVLLPGDRRVPADIVAYDYETGFGLLRALSPLGVPPIELGESAELREEAQVLAVGYGSPPQIVPAKVVSRRTFAGYWEYLLPEAIFTAPPHPSFGGAALITREGNLVGIGSLIVGEAVEDEARPGNMFVPIDALRPIYTDLLEKGRGLATSRPWLGVYSEEFRGHVIVTRVAPGGPASQAGVKANDVIAEVAGEPVATLAEFYRAIWALGNAGAKVPLTLVSPGGIRPVTVTSGDRYDWLKLAPTY
ncbi:MAG: S1C family serine protease [Kiloniellales bacterium]|nr:S1C family serine protease [Kiloniellales bacterium]